MNAPHVPPPTKTPADITSPGWREIATRTWRAASSQHSSLDAAGIAFFGIWALFPALVVLVGLGALLFDRSEILNLLSRVRMDVPESFAVVVVGFGSLGAVTLFFLWSYLTVLIVLLGAQVNAEMERQA